MSRHAEVATLIKELHAQGFIVTVVPNGHYQAQAPAELGGRKTQFAKTPSDHRSLKNCVTRLKRIGFKKECK